MASDVEISISAATTTLTGSSRMGSERDFYRRLLDLGGQSEIEHLLDQALALIVEVTSAEMAYLELRDPEDSDHGPRFWKGHRITDADVEIIRRSISRGIIARTLAEGDTVMTASALTDERFQYLRSVQRHEIHAVLCSPIGMDPPVGVVYLQGTEREAGFSIEDRERAELFARQLAPLADRLLARFPAATSVDHTRAIRARFRCDGIVGRSAALAHMLQQAALVAPLDIDVLITGPSGTGKTALARAIADNSQRSNGPFVAVNCAAIPDTLIESELFGAERGAHSTATRRQTGLVAEAEGGTLFLDEIGEMSLGAQAKILHLLQAREYRLLGAGAPIRANVRIMSATNADLRQRVAERRFREDLYYRLHVMPVAVPPLSERRDDIPALIAHVCASTCRRHGFSPMTITPRALLTCREAAWPGNIRELANAVEAAVIRAHGESSSVIHEHHIFPDRERAAAPGMRPTFHGATRELHRRLLLEALERNDWNVAAAASELDLSKSQVYNLINSLGIKQNR